LEKVSKGQLVIIMQRKGTYVMRSENIIEVTDLTKLYGSLLAVDRISFEVKNQELFGFLGPNGAGKTTTINMLTGITKPTSGKASIAGYDITKEPIKAKELIGVVPDVSGVYDEMTALGNIDFSAKLHSVPKEKRKTRAKELLELFSLYDRRNDRVGTFSRGMKKRLMIATTLIYEPKIIFLDEPTTGLDVQSSRQIRDLIKEMNKNGTTFFLTTHYIEEADQLCQRIAIINKGRIITVDTPEKLKKMAQTDNVIEISFNKAEDFSEKLKELSHVKNVIRVADKFRLNVEEPSEMLPLIVDFASHNHLKVTSIITLKPTLEDAFVSLTSLRPDALANEKEPLKTS
jgi:ABC-2 type transport system ATP-binding protein